MRLLQEGLVCGRAAKLEGILREAQTGQAPLPKSFPVDRREIFELVSSSKIENFVRMEIQIHLIYGRVSFPVCKTLKEYYQGLKQEGLLYQKGFQQVEEGLFSLVSSENCLLFLQIMCLWLLFYTATSE